MVKVDDDEDTWVFLKLYFWESTDIGPWKPLVTMLANSGLKVLARCPMILEHLPKKYKIYKITRTRQFIKIRVVFHTPDVWNEAGDPQFLMHFWNK